MWFFNGMDAVTDHQDTLIDKVKASFGFAMDAFLGAGPAAAILLYVEHMIGAAGAGIVFAFAIVTAFYRFRYWRTKAAREQEALRWDRMR